MACTSFKQFREEKNLQVNLLKSKKTRKANAYKEVGK